MFEYLRRLATTGAAYTASSVLSKLIAVALLPLYTALPDAGRLRRRRGDARLGRRGQHRRPPRPDRGAAALLLPRRTRTRERVVRTGFAALFWATTLAPLIALAVRRADLRGAARPSRRRAGAARGARPLGADPVRVRAHPAARRRARPRLLRAHGAQRAGDDPGAPCWLVVVEDQGAAGSCSAPSAPARSSWPGCCGSERRRLSLRLEPALLRRMIRFGLPTMPAELSLYSLNFIDRILIVRLAGLAEAGLYALAIKFAQGINVLVRGFQLAWPPLAYSIADDDEARRAYASSSPGSRPSAPSLSPASGCCRAGSSTCSRRPSSSSPTRRSACSRPGSRSTRSTWCWS